MLFLAHKNKPCAALRSSLIFINFILHGTIFSHLRILQTYTWGSTRNERGIYFRPTTILNRVGPLFGLCSGDALATLAPCQGQWTGAEEEEKTERAITAALLQITGVVLGEKLGIRNKETCRIYARRGHYAAAENELWAHTFCTFKRKFGKS